MQHSVKICARPLFIYITELESCLSRKKRRRRIRRWFSTVCLKCPFTKESNNLIATEVAILILKYEIIETLVDSERGKRHTRTWRERVHESPCRRDLTPPFRMMTRRSQAVYAVPTLRVYHCSLEEYIYLFPGYPFGGSKRFAFVSSLIDNAYFVIVQNLKCIVRLAAALYLECCFRDKERLRGRQETET